MSLTRDPLQLPLAIMVKAATTIFWITGLFVDRILSGIV